MNRLKTIASIALTAALIGGCETQDQDRVSETTPISGPNAQSNIGADSQFLREAAVINQAEVEAGRLAVQRATDPEVRRFGQMLATDHQTSLQKLQELAGTQQVELPTELDQKHREAMSRLQQAEGSTFDRAFTREMIKGHEEAIAKFEAQMRSGRNAQAKSYAANALPDLREHLRIAREIDARLANGQSATGMGNSMDHQHTQPNR